MVVSAVALLTLCVLCTFQHSLRFVPRDRSSLPIMGAEGQRVSPCCNHCMLAHLLFDIPFHYLPDLIWETARSGSDRGVALLPTVHSLQGYCPWIDIIAFFRPKWVAELNRLLLLGAHYFRSPSMIAFSSSRALQLSVLPTRGTVYRVHAVKSSGKLTCATVDDLASHRISIPSTSEAPPSRVSDPVSTWQQSYSCHR